MSVVLLFVFPVGAAAAGATEQSLLYIGVISLLLLFEPQVNAILARLKTSITRTLSSIR